MDDFVCNILELVEQLRGTEGHINDEHTVALTLGGLPVSYDNLIMVFEARLEVKLTLKYVKNKMIDGSHWPQETLHDNSLFKTHDHEKYKTFYSESASFLWYSWSHPALQILS